MVGAGLQDPPVAQTGAAARKKDLPEALVVRGLCAAYGSRPVLRGLDLEVRGGELVTLLGANGSGKSTALRCLAGLLPADAGTITLYGEPLGLTTRTARTQVGMIFQQPQLVRRSTVLDNVCAGALGRLPLRHSLTRLLLPHELRVTAMECLDRVGLADRAADRAGRLSGGQQQRVAVARALCQGAPLLLADEPVSALDPASAEQVLVLLRSLAHDDGLAVLTVLHQPDLARRHSDRLVGLRDGVHVFDARPSRVSAAAVTSLYAHEELS